MNIYEVSELEQELDKIASESGGEVPEEKIEALVKAQTNSMQQLEKLGNYVLHLEMYSRMVAEEIKRLQDLKKRSERRADSIREWVTPFILSKAGRFTAGIRQFSVRKSESVNLDEEILSKDYYREKITREPDKVKIKEDLKDGKKINGAWLVERDNLQIR